MAKDADRLRLTELAKDRHFSGVKLDKPLFRGATTGEVGLRELSDLARDDKYDSDYEFTKSELYGTPLSKGAISAGFKKLKDAPLREKLGSPTARGELDTKAAQAAREAGAEERREARGMKSGGSVSPSKKVLAKSGFYDKGKTKSEREKIVGKVTTKPQRVKMVEKMLSTKKMKSGGSVSKRADGVAIRGKTRGRMV